MIFTGTAIEFVRAHADQHNLGRKLATAERLDDGSYRAEFLTPSEIDARRAAVMERRTAEIRAERVAAK